MTFLDHPYYTKLRQNYSENQYFPVQGLERKL